MATANGTSEGSNNDMANTLKEMLKINSSSSIAAEQNIHNGAGDGLPLTAPPNNEELVSAQEEVQNHLQTVETILLRDVEDGRCVVINNKHTRIVASPRSEIDSTVPASNKVKVNTVTKFDWDHKYYTGSLISVTNTYIAYTIKGHTAHSVRVINRHNSSNRVLLKGFSGIVCDVAFASPRSNILAAVDSVGNLIVWELTDVAGNIESERKICIESESTVSDESGTFRVIWIPFVNLGSKENSLDGESSSYQDTIESADSETQRMLVLSYGRTAEVWDLDAAFEISAGKKIRRADLGPAYVAVTHDDVISDCELSPIGNVLAAASYDGYVKFWQIQMEDTQPSSCLHKWKPHDGKPVSCVKFCDNRQKSEFSVYWRFLLTGCDRNNELKMWCSVTWNCLQVISFAPSTPAHALPELNLVLHASVDFVVLTDINRKVLYVMQCKTDLAQGAAQLTSITPYQLTSPLLSVDFVEARACKFKSLDDAGDRSPTAAKLYGRSSPFDDVDDDDDDDEESGSGDEPRANEANSHDGDTDHTAKKLNGFLLKLLAIQSKSLQNLDIRFIPNRALLPASDVGVSQENLSTYNTITDSMKDSVSLSSMDDNIPSHSGVLGNDEPDRESAAGEKEDEERRSSEEEDATTPPALLEGHFVPRANEQEDARVDDAQEANHDDTLVASQPLSSPDQIPLLTQHSHSSSTSQQEKSVAPDVTRSVSPPQPLLLTPDAFMGSMKSPGNLVESANTSFTAVTPFSNRDEAFYQNQDLLLGSRNPLSNLVLSPSTIGGGESSHQGGSSSHNPIPPEEDPATPPSSPVHPRASSSPGSQVEVPHHSIRTRSIKSPDLISSTSTLEGDKEPGSGNAVADQGTPPPSLVSSSLLGRAFSNTGPPHLPSASSSVDRFPPVLLPSTSAGPSGTAWPKAPDVTMSRSMSARTPPGVGMQQQQPNLEPIFRPSQAEPQAPQEVDVQPSLPDRGGVDSRELIRLLNELQTQQRDLMSGHQRELQSMTKKQSQVQKQNATSNKRNEQQVERMEKSLLSVSDTQRRLVNDMKAMQAGVTEATASKIGRVIKGEIKQTVLPGLQQTMEPLKEQLSQAVMQKLTATDAVMRDNVAKIVKSKETVDCIAANTAQVLQSKIQTSLPEIVFATIVPAFERSSQAMFQQLSATYMRGTEEVVSKVEKQLQYRLKPEQDRLHGLIKEAQDATNQLQGASKRLTADVAALLQKQLPAEIDKSMLRCEERITASVQEAIRKQQETAFTEHSKALADMVRQIVAKTMDEKLAQAPGADVTTLAAGAGVTGQLGARPQSRPNVFDQQQQILKMLQQGNVNTAFQTALTASDLNLVMYVCETVDPAVVFGVSPCPLQQPILLSLIQQLSSDLTTKTEVKLKYLQEAVMNLDRRHQVTQEYMHSVLSALVQKLQTCAQGPLENPSLGKDLKMLAMAAQSLVK